MIVHSLFVYSHDLMIVLTTRMVATYVPMLRLAVKSERKVFPNEDIEITGDISYN